MLSLPVKVLSGWGGEWLPSLSPLVTSRIIEPQAPSQNLPQAWPMPSPLMHSPHHTGEGWENKDLGTQKQAHLKAERWLEKAHD